MLKKKNSNNYLTPFIIVASFLGALYLNHKIQKPIIEISKQDSATNINRDFLKLISMGNKRLISDLIWIKTLLDSDAEKYQKKDFNNWMYHRFRTIAELDPNFYHNYLWGGMYLSIIKDDLEAAADIYTRGLNIFPDDYRLNYNAGFNFYYELGQFKEGLKYLAKIETHPESPPMLRFIINKLRFETTNDFDAALSFLMFSIERNDDPVLDRKLRKDYYALKAERDLNCLNSGHNDCEMKDANGDSYVQKNGTWTSLQPFVPYKIHLRSK